MNLKKIKKLGFLAVIAAIFAYPYFAGSSDNFTEKLRGRILLQTQQEGQAWYVDPNSRTRVYLARPEDALKIMKGYGSGITHKDLVYFQEHGFPDRLKGKILLDVEDKGKAYYIFPEDQKGYYLGSPRDAFNIMRNLGLGITIRDLEKTPVAEEIEDINIQQDPPQEKGVNSKTYIWDYNGKEYTIEVELFDSIYNYYKDKSKVLTYNSQDETQNWREQYFDLYLTTDSTDDAFKQIASKLKQQAQSQGLNEDKTAELALSFVQSIPYDHQLADRMLSNSDNAYMKYPYEVLYENKGTCGGKSFLTILLFKELGYGTALFEFEEDDHLAPAIQCSEEYSTYDSGYCYAEPTTIGYPIGIIPRDNPADFSDSQLSQIEENSSIDTQSLDILSQGTLYRKTDGDIYTGIERNIDLLNTIRSLKEEINQQQQQLSEKREQINTLQEEIARLGETLETYKENEQYQEYNDLLPTYNEKVTLNRNLISEYNELVNQYNSNTAHYNELVENLYQQ